MQEEVKKEIIEVLKESINAIKKNNLTKLREQSNRTVHNTSIYQDQYSISISVVIFTILKILEKNSENKSTVLKKAQNTIIKEFKEAIIALKKEERYNYSKSLKKIIFVLKKIDKETNNFMQQAIETSKIKKAYGLYRHGVSAGKAAELLGISKWELQPYLGQSKESEQFNVSKSVETRIKEVMEIFNLR